MSTLSVDTIQGQTTVANVKFPAGTCCSSCATYRYHCIYKFDTSTGTEYNIMTLILQKYNQTKF